MGLKFDFDSIDGTLAALGRGKVLGLMERVMRKTGDVYEAEAVALAPHKFGHLENSSTVRTHRRGSAIETVIAFTASYAAQVHELPPSRRGKQTVAKPATKFGVAGPKYLERVLRGMDFEHFIGRGLVAALKETLGRG